MSTRTASSRQNLLIVLLVLVAVGTFAWFFALPKAQDTLAEIDATKQQTKSLTVQAQEAENAVTHAADLKDQIRRDTTMVPASPDVPSILDQVQSVASASGIGLEWQSGSATQSDAGESGVNQWVLSADVTASQGGKDALVNFLAKLSTLPRVVTVDSFDLLPTTDGGADGLTASIRMRFYATGTTDTLAEAAAGGSTS